MIKNISECKHFEGCYATLCPLHEDLDSCVWYPDEEVCRLTKFKSWHWIKRQKSLRKHKATVDNGYFTRKMLDNMYACSARTKGENPDSRKNMKWVDPYVDTKTDPMPKLQGVKGVLKHKLGHPGVDAGIKEKQLVLV